MPQQIAYFDRLPQIVASYRTGVSLHSHTLHSKESAPPLGKHLQASGVVGQTVCSVSVMTGGVRSLQELCGAKPAFSLRCMIMAAHMLSHPFIKPALAWATP